MRLFDLHCDTALSLFDRGMRLENNSLHIDLAKAAGYAAYVQVSAVWAREDLDDEAAWQHYLAVSDHFAGTVERCPDAVLVTDALGIREAVRSGKRAFLPSVEDARILAGDIARLDTLYARGIRILTLQWKGDTCIGGGYNTDTPLSDFGRTVVRRCFEVGILPDVSHASRPVTAEVIRLARDAGKPLIASHSCAYSCHDHPRNLTDEEFRAVAEMGGLVGVSLVPGHLCDTAHGSCTPATVAAHIRHFLSLGGADSVCLGCDLDGVSRLPEGIRDLSELPLIADALRADGVSEDTVEKVFFGNAYDFFLRNL